MSIQGAINQTIGTAALIKKLEQDSPSGVNKQVKALMKKSEEIDAKKSNLDWGKAIYNKMEGAESQYPLIQFPDGYMKAKENLAKKITEKNLTQSAVKKKRQSYLDRPTSIGGTVRDLNLSPEQKRSVRAQLKGGK